MPATKQAKGPRYKLTKPAYLHDVLYEEGDEITWDGEPEYYMEPINAEAKARVQANPPKHRNPIDALTVVGPGADSIPA